MIYQSAQALRTALERRLLTQAGDTGISLDRLRRRVLFERIVARLAAVEPGRWVVKGGMALEVRLRDDARLTKDIDLGLRDNIDSAPDLHERLIDILSADPHCDYFIFTASPPRQLRDDSGGILFWRAKIGAQLADKPFGGVQLDVSPRAHELRATDMLVLPSSLEFAGIPSVEVETVDIHRHAAEKFHGMLRDFGERENSRVRDLVDLMILLEHDLLVPEKAAAAIRTVWLERNNSEPPDKFPSLPESWPDRYRRILAGNDRGSSPYAEAAARIAVLWAGMFICR